ncbi:protein SYS1 homolog [Mytilus edulis]
MLRLIQNGLNKMPGQFRSFIWDPKLIISQIIALQCLFYATYIVFIYLLDIAGRFDASLDQIFTQIDLDLFEDTGRVNVIGFFLNSLTSAAGLWFIVKRTKLCLDFAFTVHFVHFCCCWVYSGHIPQTLSWWIINVIGLALMTVCGEFLCMRSEMKAIPLLGPKTDL